MTYNAFETSVESGTPVELYRFDVGGELFLRTSADNDFTVNAPDPFQGTYTSSPITRSRVKQTSARTQSQNLEVTMLVSDEIVARYISLPPGQRADLTIVRIHREDPDEETIVYWEGTVRSFRFDDEAREATAIIENAVAGNNRTTPRFVFSATCNHTLYDSRCKVDRNDPSFRKDLTVTAVSGSVLTLGGAAAFGADFFERGYVEFNGDFRSILRQSGDDLTLILPFSESPLGQVVAARAGCKLRYQEDCIAKFGNGVNNGSFPWVPTKNPFETGLD